MERWAEGALVFAAWALAAVRALVAVAMLAPLAPLTMLTPLRDDCEAERARGGRGTTCIENGAWPVSGGGAVARAGLDDAAPPLARSLFVLRVGGMLGVGRPGSMSSHFMLRLLERAAASCARRAVAISHLDVV
jgi:hypothetical protein